MQWLLVFVISAWHVVHLSGEGEGPDFFITGGDNRREELRVIGKEGGGLLGGNKFSGTMYTLSIAVPNP